MKNNDRTKPIHTLDSEERLAKLYVKPKSNKCRQCGGDFTTFDPNIQTKFVSVIGTCLDCWKEYQEQLKHGKLCLVCGVQRAVDYGSSIHCRSCLEELSNVLDNHKWND